MEHSETPSSFDWTGAFTRLDHVRRAIETSGERSAAQIAAILAERAEKLGRPREKRSPHETEADLLVCSLGGEPYGIELTRVLEVVPLKGVIPLPCVPGFVVGALSHRGRILPILDLHRLHEPQERAVSPEGRAIVVEGNGVTLALLADEVSGVRRMSLREGVRPMSPDGRGTTLVRGITDGVAILDVESVVADPRILVDDEVG